MKITGSLVGVLCATPPPHAKGAHAREGRGEQRQRRRDRDSAQRSADVASISSRATGDAGEVGVVVPNRKDCAATHTLTERAAVRASGDWPDHLGIITPANSADDPIYRRLEVGDEVASSLSDLTHRLDFE